MAFCIITVAAEAYSFYADFGRILLGFVTSTLL